MIEQAGRRNLRAPPAAVQPGAWRHHRDRVMMFTNKWVVAIISGLVASALPFLKLSKARANRLNKFEEQLPDALGIMSRGLKAGYPFSETLKLVSDDLDDPVAKEFEITFNDVNYGGDLRACAGRTAGAYSQCNRHGAGECRHDPEGDWRQPRRTARQAGKRHSWTVQVSAQGQHVVR